MLKINKKLSEQGFSLIELMVAVVILAMVIFGIFLTFTTGFQGMADAKDRTTASNYAQLILEDYKNTAFEKVISFSQPIEGSKFTRNIIVNLVDPNETNLKKVIAEISWTDRNGKSKNVISSMLIYDSQGDAESGAVAAGIFLYADPYYNLLPGTDGDTEPAKIIAEVIDENGYLVTDWSGANVEFTIESAVNLDNVSYGDPSYLGSLGPTSVFPEQGKANTTFSPYATEKREGYVKIKATLDIGSGVEIYDTLTLKITDGAVAILLSTDKNIIATGGGEDGTATITATIVNAVNAPIDSDKEVNFSIISGPGNLVNYVPTSVGLSYIDLTSGSTAGFTTIIATSPLLEGDSIDIEIRNPGLNIITVETDKSIIVQQGSATITAYLKNYLEIPIPSGETIEFSIIGEGELSPVSNTTGDDGEATTILTMNYAGTAVVTASWTAEDSTVISDSVEVMCKNHYIFVWADPRNITEGGSTTIKAELTDYEGNSVIFETIIFTIIGGSGSFSSDIPLLSTSATTDESGVALVTLSIDSPGTTIVEAKWIGDPDVVTGEEVVSCTSAPVYQIELSPTSGIIILEGETVLITATVTSGGSSVGSGTEVTFSLNDYTNAKLDNQSSSVTALTDIDGIASVTLSGFTAGEIITITATVGTDSNSITVTCEAVPISIVLADPSNIQHGIGSSGKQQVYFDIEIMGGNVGLNEMKILWTPDGGEKLNTVYIDDDEVYNLSDGALNGSVIRFNRVPSFELIKGSAYTIKMIFNNDVKKKNWDITFKDPDPEIEDISTVSFYLN
jgi:prepilin-type N-terminal cleavage/methylation domain-containing protein